MIRRCLTITSGFLALASGVSAQFVTGGGATGATTFASPTGTIGLAPIGGSSGSAQRSDATPALSQAISPTWTGTHTFANAIILGSVTGSTQCLQVNASGTVLGTGAPCGGSGGVPGGSSGQIQYNNAGVFGGLAVTGSGSVVEATSPTLITPTLSGTTLTGTNTLSGTISGSGITSLFASPPQIGGTSPPNATLSTAKIANIQNYSTSHLLIALAAPVIASGFGTGATVVANNGAAAFTINVGSTPSPTGVITMPSNSNTGWNCYVNDVTTFSASVFLTRTTSVSGTSITVGNFTNAGASGSWNAGDLLKFVCLGE